MVLLAFFLLGLSLSHVLRPDTTNLVSSIQLLKYSFLEH